MARFADDIQTTILAPDLRRAMQGVEPHLAPLYASLIAPVGGSSLVFGQVGQSLDGRVATRAGDAKAISGAAGIRHLHRLRALADVVIVGASTVLHDDPRLTVRDCDGSNPARVVVDPRGRVPSHARVFNDDGARRIVVQSRAVPRPSGVETIEVPAPEGRIDPSSIIAALAGLGLHRIMVEGGARTLSPFLLEGALNRLLITVSPLIIGDGPSGLTFPGVPNLCDCLRPDATFYDLGGELVVDCALQA
jgi:riboflavin-specific deaminase-like protein